jgi:hypothetical protein
MDDRPIGRSPAWGLFVLLGVYFTFAGYRSFEGDQAYRLPLLLHQLEPKLYAHDPFVSAFDRFNPHQGYLRLLGVGTRLIGLPATLFIGFVLTFGVSGWALGRLTRAVWPGDGPAVGTIAFGLALVAHAGNIGTNHLFEPILLDRLVALGLGWTALGSLVVPTSWAPLSVAGCIAAASVVHPSLGLQWGLLLTAAWLACGLLAGWRGVARKQALAGAMASAVVLLPAIIALPATTRVLFEGMDPAQYHVVAAYVQSPQHMVPHLWRFPQWLAWFAYLAAAGLGIAAFREPADQSNVPDAAEPRRRLLCVLGLLLAGLLVAGLAIEAGNSRVTLFQTFRMATAVRGLCLVLVSGPVYRLWQRGTFAGRLRACLMAAALTADWPMVWIIGLEALIRLAERGGRRVGASSILGSAAAIAWWLRQHDPEQGFVALGAAIPVAGLAQILSARLPRLDWTPKRRLRLAGLVWTIPAIAVTLQLGGVETTAWPLGVLKAHLRVTETPIDDLERLALWCRDHTPSDARFIGPPGPKGFRLWSRRALAFNRAGSPYHAAGLADWAARFQAHVGHTGDLAGFARSYLANRQELEQRFDHWDAEQLARLATGQGAGYVLAASSAALDDPAGDNLALLRTEGRYAVYKVQSNRVSERPMATAAHEESTLPR